MKKNKVLFISDFNIEHNIGGAQRSNDIILKDGRSFGFDITEATFETNFNDIKFDEFDAVVSSNLHAIRSLNGDIIKKISAHPFHVRLEHDLCQYLTPQERIELFSSCKKTVFLTEFHREVMSQRYRQDFFNVEIIPDPIDIDKFYDKKLERSDEILYVGYMHEFKGTVRFFDFAFNNPQIKFVVAGWTDSPMLEFLANKTPNVKFLGAIEHEKMPDLYNSYARLFYSPNVPEPFCRSVCEAMFCGMQLVVQARNIGCVNSIQTAGLDSFKLSCATATTKFWDLFE